MINLSRVFDEIGILEFVESIEEDEFGNTTYSIKRKIGTVELYHSKNDDDIKVKINSDLQSHSLIELNLTGCTSARAVQDKRGSYIEIWGTPEVVGLIRNEITKKFGYRLWLDEDVTLEILNE